MSDQWTDKLRDKLLDYETPAPEGLWQVIMAEVSPAHVVPVWRRMLHYAVYPAAAAVVGVIGYSLLSRPEMTVVRNVPEVPVIAEWHPSRPEVMTGDVPATDVVVVPTSSALPREESVIAPTVMETVPATLTTDTTEEIPVVTMQDEDDGREEQNPVEQNTMSQQWILHELPAPRTDRPVAAIESNRYSRTGQLTMSVYASNLSAQEPTAISGYGDHFPVSIPNASGIRTMAYTQDLKEEIVTLNSAQETKSTTQYSMPIKIGFSISYYLTNRLAIEAGLSATRLSTKVTTGTMQYRTQTEYQIYMLGMPLGLKYTLWDHGHLGLYVSGGAMVESRIARHATNEYSINAAVVRDPAVVQKKGGAQLLWSLRGAVGVSYSIGPQVGLFLEPGVAYYLNRRTLHEVTQMTAPAVPSLTLGLNLSF